MKYKIGNGIEAEGTPAEIAEFLQLRHYKGSTDISTAPVVIENVSKAKPTKRVYKLSEAQRKKNREYQRLWLARKKAKTTEQTESVISLPEDFKTVSMG